VISPCPTLYARRNKLGDGLDAMNYYKEKSVIKNGAPTSEAGIGFQGEIVCGKFIDRERETWIDAYDRRHQAALGAKFTPYPTGLVDANKE
jgi:2-oxoglutarate ferredoxin oxidoreductase subunit beta